MLFFMLNNIVYTMVRPLLGAQPPREDRSPHKHYRDSQDSGEECPRSVRSVRVMLAPFAPVQPVSLDIRRNLWVQITAIHAARQLLAHKRARRILQ